jgi:hypothetical protein
MPKANCQELVTRCRRSPENGRDYVAQIWRSQANIVVMEEIDIAEPADWIGSMKDTIEILGDIVSPANDEDDWEVLQD